MPYTRLQIVNPEIAISAGGLSVYHTYRGGFVENGKRRYWFTLNQDDLSELDHFDVRELCAWNETQLPPGDDLESDDARVKAVLRRAIMSAELRLPT